MSLAGTLANGVRVLALPMPERRTAAVSVFVRSGSAHEGRHQNGISHFLEHMVFKGSRTRDVERINRDAEQLGAEVNAHTDKDHTAFHMRGLPEHARQFVQMLGDIVLHPSFPQAELERERQVLLHELTEDEDDPMSTAYKLFDSACFGLHAAAQPIIGTRHRVEAITRADLQGWRERQYSGANVIVAAGGAIDAQALTREVEAVFADLPPGQENRLAPPAWHGGVKARHLAGTQQAHLVMGYPIATLHDDDPVPAVAAALFGEGMSSPLLHELREKRGLLYYAACSADVLDVCGQFVIEVSTSPQQLHECLREVLRLLEAHAASIDPHELERARNQVKVRLLRDHEHPTRCMEDSALELFARGALQPIDARLAGIDGVTAAQLRDEFARMLGVRVALAAAGELGRGAGARLRDTLGAAGRP